MDAARGSQCFICICICLAGENFGGHRDKEVEELKEVKEGKEKGTNRRPPCFYLCVMTYTPSQFCSGPATKYSLQRLRYMRAGPSSGHRSSSFSKMICASCQRRSR